MLTKTEFAREIRQALNNLSDFVYLQNLELTKMLSRSGQSLDRSVRQLRGELVDAIEQLKPADDVPPLAKEQRPYVLLYGRYIEGMSTPELVEESMISVRQLRREHKRALEAIVDLLWDKWAERLAATSRDIPEPLAAAKVETEQLISQAHLESLDLVTLVRGVVSTLTPLARERNIVLDNRLPGDLPPVRADRIILRQGILELISYAIGRAEKGEVLIEKGTGPGPSLRIVARGRPPAGESTGVRRDVSQRLISSLGGQVEISDTPTRWQVTVSLAPAGDVSILVMDDNAGLIALFRRYLAGRGYRLIEAHTADEAIRQARELPLKLIVLDIMMPQQDGWEVLHHLRKTPATSDVPIIICSVLNEPDLALSLGASDFLAKPVTQDALLTKIEQWCGVLPASAG